jgi:hypothetical protein
MPFVGPGAMRSRLSERSQASDVQRHQPCPRPTGNGALVRPVGRRPTGRMRTLSGIPARTATSSTGLNVSIPIDGV